MAKKKKKQVKPVSVIAIVLCSFIVLFLVISIIKQVAEKKQLEAELESEKAVLESRISENQELEVAVSEGDEEELAEQYAKEKGYVMPDERVYVDITPGSEE